MDYFKIDETPAFQLGAAGNSIPVTPRPALKHPYNLLNLDVYDFNCVNVVNQANEYYYKTHFFKRLNENDFLNDEIELVKFLTYQYENSKNKDKYLLVLEYSIFREMASPDSYWFAKILERWIKNKKEELNPKEEEGAKDKLSHKRQVLLLKQLGFFDLEMFSKLNETQKGILVGHLLNRDEKNSEDYIRYVRGTKGISSKFKINTPANKKIVNELLEKVGLKEYMIK